MYILTGSALQLGLVGLARAAPYMLLTVVGGAAADVMERRRLLIITQIVQMLVSGWLIVTVMTGSVSAWTLYAVTFLSGAAQAFDQPARQAMVANVVPAEELSSAFTLNTLLRQATAIAGPGIGGLLIGYVGLGWTYGANAISFVALLAAVLCMHPVQVVTRGGSNWDKIAGGFRFALAQPLVLTPLLIDFVTRLPGNTRGLLPIFAEDIYHVGPQGLGWLSAAVAAGAVAGGLALGSVGPLERPLPLMVTMYALEGLALLALGLSPSFPLAILILFLMGIANVGAEVPRITVVQTLTPDELRGRVSALSSVFTQGGPLLGQLSSGLTAAELGAPVAAILAGGVMAGATIAFGLTPSLRHAYMRRLLPNNG